MSTLTNRLPLKPIVTSMGNIVSEVNPLELYPKVTVTGREVDIKIRNSQEQVRSESRNGSFTNILT